MTRKETIAEGIDLYLGDCREILPTLGKVDAVVTDPPYGKGYYETDVDHGDLIFDLISGPTRCAIFSYPEILVHWSKGLAPSEWITWWPSNAALRSASRTAKVARESESIGIWGDVIRATKRARTSEGATLAHTNGHSIDKSMAVLGDVWCDPSPGLGFNHHQRQHPNEKSLSVMCRLVEMLSDAGETVLDPFMGSGTTGVAAVKLGRRFTGIEVDPHHFDTACKRIQAAINAPDMFAATHTAAKQEAFKI